MRYIRLLSLSIFFLGALSVGLLGEDLPYDVAPGVDPKSLAQFSDDLDEIAKALQPIELQKLKGKLAGMSYEDINASIKKHVKPGTRWKVVEVQSEGYPVQVVVLEPESLEAGTNPAKRFSVSFTWNSFGHKRFLSGMGMQWP